MTYKLLLLMCLIMVMCMFSGTLSLAIYRDSDIFKKVQRGGKQLNDISLYEDEYPMSPYRDRESRSRWESADWPEDPEEFVRTGDGDHPYESEEKPEYSWFYHNKYINNGMFNHLYNGPKNNEQGGMGDSTRRNNVPKILPRPAPSFRHAIHKKIE